MIFKKTGLPIAPQSDKRTRLAFVARLHKQLLQSKSATVPSRSRYGEARRNRTVIGIQSLATTYICCLGRKNGRDQKSFSLF